jgi:hypothetical protein
MEMLKSIRIVAAAFLVAAAPALAQIQTVDPDRAYDQSPPQPGAPAPSDWADPPASQSQSASPSDSEWVPVDTGQAQDQGAWAQGRGQNDNGGQPDNSYQPDNNDRSDSNYGADRGRDGDQIARRTMEREATVPRRDVFNAAEGVFGRGAQGLGTLLERILREQGEPSAYIAGSEAGGAFVFGLRYGSGIMHHQIEGDRTVYWTGPSLGFDAGADANKVFVLVYNLNDSQDLFKRFPAGEGHAYFIGGFSAQYMRHGDIVLIPIRLGVGLRLGINAGYMRFSERNRWLPF